MQVAVMAEVWQGHRGGCLQPVESRGSSSPPAHLHCAPAQALLLSSLATSSSSLSSFSWLSSCWPASPLSLCGLHGDASVAVMFSSSRLLRADVAERRHGHEVRRSRCSLWGTPSSCSPGTVKCMRMNRSRWAPEASADGTAQARPLGS